RYVERGRQKGGAAVIRDANGIRPWHHTVQVKGGKKAALVLERDLAGREDVAIGGHETYRCAWGEPGARQRKRGRAGVAALIRTDHGEGEGDGVRPNREGRAAARAFPAM